MQLKLIIQTHSYNTQEGSGAFYSRLCIYPFCVLLLKTESWKFIYNKKNVISDDDGGCDIYYENNNTNDPKNDDSGYNDNNGINSNKNNDHNSIDDDRYDSMRLPYLT